MQKKWYGRSGFLSNERKRKTIRRLQAKYIKIRRAGTRARALAEEREIESSKPPPSPMKKKNGEVKLSVAPKKVAIQGASAPAAAPAAPAEPTEQRASASSSLELCSSA